MFKIGEYFKEKSKAELTEDVIKLMKKVNELEKDIKKLKESKN